MDALKGIDHSIDQSVVSEHSSGKTQKSPVTSFADTLKNYYYEVDSLKKDADSKMQDFAVGENSNIHEIMIATEKASLSFKLLVQIRNKLLEAYQEISRMGI